MRHHGPPISTGPNEQQLLVEICRPAGPSLQRVAQLDRAGIDWDALRQRALDEGVIALLAHRLRNLSIASLPDRVVALIDLDHSHQSITALRHTAELMRLAGIFEAENIDCIPLKGPALAALAYGDVAARQSWDLDVLIQQRDLARARELLKRLGVTANEPMTERQLRKHSATRSALTFSSAAGLRLDLHWQLHPSYVGVRLDIDKLFETAVWQSIEGHRVRRLADSDLLVYLAVHGARHVWEKLLLVLDFSLVAPKVTTDDWERLLMEAEQTQARRMLLTALALAGGVGYLSIPESLSAEIQKDRTAVRIARKIEAKLMRGGRSLNLWEIARHLFLMQQSTRGRASYLASTVFVPSVGDWKSTSLPRALGFLYWPVRVLRLARGLMIARLQENRKQTPGSQGPESVSCLRVGQKDFAQLTGDILRSSIPLRFEAQGSSMLPFIRSGDVLTVEPVCEDILSTGDVVLYRTESGNCLVHRIIGKRLPNTPDFFAIRGDAHYGPWDEVRGDQILGRVTEAQRGTSRFTPGRGWRRTTARMWAMGAPVTVRSLNLLLSLRRLILGPERP